MYTQKSSYFLAKDGYKLAINTIRIDQIHKSESKVKYSIVHIWKAQGKKDKTVSLAKGWIDIPGYFISIRSKQVLADQYFQTDDRDYTIYIRHIGKKTMPRLIKHIQETTLNNES